MPVDGDAGATLRRLGWHQGALIPVPADSRLADLLPPGTGHAVVASQDCDIVAPSSTESAVDLLPAVMGTNPESDLLYGKNPRRLCLALVNGRFATTDIRSRVTVDKRLLDDIPPLSEGPGPRERKLLAKWLAKRYVRPAFPDAFNGRLRMVRAKLEALSKKAEGKHVTAILMMLDTEEELADDVAYHVVVWLACRSNSVGEPKIRVGLERYAQAFAEVMASCGGINVAEYEVKPHVDITLEDLDAMKRFDFDYRSEAPKPGGENAPVE